MSCRWRPRLPARPLSPRPMPIGALPPIQSGRVDEHLVLNPHQPLQLALGAEGDVIANWQSCDTWA